MFRKTMLAAVLAAAVPMSGCVTMMGRKVVEDLTPDQRYDLAKQFIARCGGSINLGGSAGTGQVGGYAAGDFRLMGTCPMPAAPAVTPLRDLGKAGAGTEIEVAPAALQVDRVVGQPLPPDNR
jgi:hypothetical protein